MLSIFETGDESFRLANQSDVNVGWVRGSALGFDGFATEAAALAAAEAGSAALGGYLERLTGATLKPGAEAGRVRVESDGEAEWVVRGSAQLARLYRPDARHADERRRTTFGVEFVLPSYVKTGAAISASQVVYHSVRTLQDTPWPIEGLADVGGDVATDVGTMGKAAKPRKAAAAGRTGATDASVAPDALRGTLGEGRTSSDGVAAR